jgi:hypothetical protein
VNPNNPSTERIIRKAQEVALAKGVQILILKAGSESEIDSAFASLVQLQAGALRIGIAAGCADLRPPAPFIEEAEMQALRLSKRPGDDQDRCGPGGACHAAKNRCLRLTLRSTSLAKEALLSTSTASSWSPPARLRAPGLRWCKHRDRRDADAEDEDDGQHANP